MQRDRQKAATDQKLLLLLGGTFSNLRTLTKGDAFTLDLYFVRKILHQLSRFEIAIQVVRNLIASGNSNIWLVGHSLGSTMAMLAGKNMIKNRILLESDLFSPSFVSALIETIKNKKVKHGLITPSIFVTAGLAIIVKAKENHR
nr:GDSL esterase/lipase At4g10955-like [Tanacetum cinerariifolium]